MSSLWGFTKLTLRKEVTDSPHGILKEQIDIFEKETNRILFGNIRNTYIKRPDCEYKLATSFEIVAPALDNYKYVLFTMYCKPEVDYPLLIFTREMDDLSDVNEYNTEFVCKNPEEFLLSLKEVLGSEDTTRIVQTLYSKSQL